MRRQSSWYELSVQFPSAQLALFRWLCGLLIPTTQRLVPWRRLAAFRSPWLAAGKRSRGRLPGDTRMQNRALRSAGQYTLWTYAV